MENNRVVKYRDLTNEDKKYLLNGCGGKGSIVNPPDFLFEASCDKHDFLYWKGCNEWHRIIADIKFYKYMIKDCFTQNKLVKIIKTGKFNKLNKMEKVKKTFYGIIETISLIMVATIYFLAVRMCGFKFFNYSSRKKTIKDLETIRKLYSKIKHKYN